MEEILNRTYTFLPYASILAGKLAGIVI